MTFLFRNVVLTVASGSERWDDDENLVWNNAGHYSSAERISLWWGFPVLLLCYLSCNIRHCSVKRLVISPLRLL